MSYDAYLITRWVQEQKPLLLRSRIQKIQQTDVHTLFFQIYHPDHGEHAFLIAADPAHPRMYMKVRSSMNEKKSDPPSVKLLRFRKWLQGGRITNVQSIPGERIVHLSIEHKNEFHDVQTETLIIEWMGRHTNAILIDASGMILESLRTITHDMTRYREIAPGRPYTPPPPQQKPLAHVMTEDDWEGLGEKAGLAELIEARKHSAPSDNLKTHRQHALSAYATWLRHTFAGISTPLAQEIAYRTLLQEDPPLTILKHTLQIILNGEEEAQWVRNSDHMTFAPLELTHLDGDKLAFSTVNEMLVYVYEHVMEERLYEHRRRHLLQPVQTRLKKLEEKIAMFDRMEAERPLIETYRQYGTALLAYAHAITHGEKNVTLDDPMGDGQQLIIPLDPDISPIQNANLYFKRAQKLQTSLQKAAQQRETAEQEKAYLESILTHLTYADAQALEEIKIELSERGFFKKASRADDPSHKKKRRGQQHDKDKKQPSVERFYSYRGSLIYVGKNNIQNDYVSLRLGKKGDLWFHVKHQPGAHVLLRPEPGHRPDEKELAEAATLAVYFSKARHSSHVPVDMTDVKNVYKPSGAPPGFVLYRDEKTLYVTVDEAIIEALYHRRFKK
ncbi:MAG: NFACT family protein [Candidatus Carbobacillus sp.]|nr:NFACT family protein [Candidatus Carbobacillus sp.]